MLNQCSFPNTSFVHIFPQPQLKQTHTAGSASTAMCILFPTKAAVHAETLDHSSSPLFDNPLCMSLLYTLSSPSSSVPYTASYVPASQLPYCTITVPDDPTLMYLVSIYVSDALFSFLVSCFSLVMCFRFLYSSFSSFLSRVLFLRHAFYFMYDVWFLGQLR